MTRALPLVALVLGCGQLKGLALPPSYELCGSAPLNEFPVVDGGFACLASGQCASLTTVQQDTSDRAHALNLVFIPEGYTDAELPEFRDRVDQLLQVTKGDDDSLVARASGHLNVFRLDFSSATDHVINADTSDTVFGGCLSPDSLNPSGEPWLAESPLATRAAVALLPELDAAIVIINSPYGRENTRRPTITLNNASSGAMLAHELGHAVLGLGDEYTDTWLTYDAGSAAFPFVYPTGVDPIAEPNVSLDASGSKWQRVVASVREGGDRYAHGLFHPTDRCRMSSEESAFCPVCAASADHFIDGLKGVNDGPPDCRVESQASLQPFTAHLSFVGLECTDPNGLASMVASLDGKSVFDLAPLKAFLPGKWTDSGQGQLAFSDGTVPGTYAFDGGTHTLVLTATDSLDASTTLSVQITAPP